MCTFMLLMLLPHGCAASGADLIYRCAGAAGEVSFTDRPCPGGQPQSLNPVVVTAMPALDAQERALVQHLDRELAARDRTAAAQRVAQVRAQARSESVRARGCAAAQAGLDRVHAIKRRGYAAASAADLQARERKYALQTDRDC